MTKDATLSWTTKVRTDAEGQCWIELPEEIVSRMGLKPGDSLDIAASPSGSLVLSRVGTRC
jgi:hypothetical protein